MIIICCACTWVNYNYSDSHSLSFAQQLFGALWTRNLSREVSRIRADDREDKKQEKSETNLWFSFCPRVSLISIHPKIVKDSQRTFSCVQRFVLVAQNAEWSYFCVLPRPGGYFISRAYLTGSEKFYLLLVVCNIWMWHVKYTILRKISYFMPNQNYYNNRIRWQQI